MKTYTFLGQKYSLVENEKDCFSVPLVEEKITDYFLPFDYIFGDFAYDKGLTLAPVVTLPSNILYTKAGNGEWNIE